MVSVAGSAREFLVFAFHEKKVVVGSVRVFLSQLSGDFMPGAYEGQFRPNGLVDVGCGG